MAHKTVEREYVGIRVPGPVKREWEQEAKQEHRSLSSWILHNLEKRHVSSSTKRPATSH